MKPLRLVPPALLLAAGAVLLSCAAPGPTAPERPFSPPLASSSSSSGSLLACSPMAYDSVTQWIGPWGGQIRVSRHVLSIPAGALTGWVSITLVAPSDTVNRIEARPEGLTFRQAAALTLSYANCKVTSAQKQVVYVSDSLGIIGYQPSWDDANGKRVTGALDHFSEYAIAW
jgi:hypothetical protein